MYDNDDNDPCLATVSDAISEWARNVGWHDRYKGCQYLLTDYDTWVINPHYTGPNQPHPEDDYADRTEDEWEEADRLEAEDYIASLTFNDELPTLAANDDIPW